jgi:hypothetical protein
MASWAKAPEPTAAARARTARNFLFTNSPPLAGLDARRGIHYYIAMSTKFKAGASLIGKIYARYYSGVVNSRSINGIRIHKE